mmetsp:Transcript_14740/g.26741  ORF Transcript_14740/g.26741 Transcript_14740/m.26741 type:complete len:383 (-) Transcript_14740:107-1255(-)|eukprot:CAMPEP_0201925428 /NCGR_PEP_ID=MMETSP0903-20130614/14673_1 /ASSEMBLY_ACC=CAM_ASM_000552 /TAXON_ID=420261 /ORGANISM="Thalassiosira antarctica, Strain CCMP982" /LENGTH=382 /DNA_ID=CAMNT_0048463103 /DNA_START=46 /DNA_END=1194 /DNA_ORIENTATION=+
MTDSPTRKKQFGAGTCWKYMEKGACPCETAKFPGSHPNLSLETITTTASGAAVAVTVASMPNRIPEWIENLKYRGFVEGDPANFAVLNATYEEREEVKALGASFSPGMKKWIVVQGQDLGPFAKWKPRIYNRSVNEVVMHNQYMDIASTVRQLQRCGMHSSHFDIRGSDREAEILREKHSTIQQGSRASAAAGKGKGQPGSIDLYSGGANNEKRRLDFDDQNTTSNTSGNNEHTSRTKRPLFSTPESLQSFVRRRHDEQTGDTPHDEVRIVLAATAEKGCEHQNEFSTLLSAAKSALVGCNSAGCISKEQKQFNEAIYTVVEALTAKSKSSDGKDTKDNDTSTTEMSPAHGNPRQKMVTPIMQNMGTDGKAPGVPGTWYDLA